MSRYEETKIKKLMLHFVIIIKNVNEKEMLGRPSESEGKKRIKEVDENNAKKMKINVRNKIDRDWRNLTKERLNTRL
jgi:hypothetical protein